MRDFGIDEGITADRRRLIVVAWGNLLVCDVGGIVSHVYNMNSVVSREPSVFRKHIGVFEEALWIHGNETSRNTAPSNTKHTSDPRKILRWGRP